MSTTSPMVPIIAPDGSIGDVPIHRLQEAVNAGAQVGKEVINPQDGSKGVIPFSRYGEYMQKYGPITGENAPSQPATQSGGVLDALRRFTGSAVAPAVGMVKGLQGAITDAPRTPQEAALDPLSRVARRLLVDPQVNELHAAQAAQNAGDNLSATGHTLAAVIPGLGPMAAQFGSTAGAQVGQGDYAGAAGSALGNAALLYAPKVLGKAGAATAGEIADRYRAMSATDPVVAAEQGARQITQAVNPKTQGFQNFIEAVQAHGGDLRDYIRANDLQVNGVLDYAKAARGLANETYQRYRSYLDPIQDQRVRVPDGYGGANAGDVRTGTGYNEMRTVGKTASLADIDRRIGDINDLTHKATTGQATMDSPTRFALEAEHGQLTNILHKSIADSLGPEITPGDVAALRQKFGKLNTIADLATDAVNDRSAATARANTGTKFNTPHSVGGMIVHEANKLRGGPNGIADSAFVKAARNAQISPSALKLADYIRQSGVDLQ